MADDYSVTEPKEGPVDEGGVGAGCAIGCTVQLLCLTIPLAFSALRVPSQVTQIWRACFLD